MRCCSKSSAALKFALFLLFDAWCAQWIIKLWANTVKEKILPTLKKYCMSQKRR